MFGPEGFGGIRGSDGEITVVGNAKAAIMARWSIRRSGTNPDATPKLRFRANFSWQAPVLMKMCSRGEMKGRIRLFMNTSRGKEQIDIVAWDEWKIDEDGALTLENIVGLDPSKMGIIR